MESTLGLVGNQSSQSYGNNVGGVFVAGNTVTVTVMKQLGENLYMLSLGKQNFEARVAAELRQGSQYQMVVEKQGDPVEMAVVKEVPPSARDESGLTPAENRWLDAFLSHMGNDEKEGVEISRRELLAFIKSLGYSIDQDAAEVFEAVKDVLPFLKQLDAAPPALRQSMAQSLLYTIQTTVLQGQGGENLFSNEALASIVRLSGEIPNWTPQDAQVFAHLVSELEALEPAQLNQIRQLLMGTTGPNGDAKLAEALDLLMARLGLEEGERCPIVNRILNDPSARLLLSSLGGKLLGEESKLPGRVDRMVAISSFLNQAPSIRNGAVSSLLEQFVHLGGKLDQLSVGQVLSATEAWKGEAPSAMQLHRTASILHLTQGTDVPANFKNSPLLTKKQNDRLPVFIDRKVLVNAGASTDFSKQIREFSGGNNLPQTGGIQRLLHTWTQAGNPLSELRGHLGSVMAWNELVTAHPEMRPQIVEALLRMPIFRGAQPVQPQQVEIPPETREAFQNALREQGVTESSLPAKAVKQTLNALQVVAGENEVTAGMAKTAAWMVSRHIEVTPKILQAVLDFQSGAKSAALWETFDKMMEQVKLPDALKAELEQLRAQMGTGSKDVRKLLSFFQKGDGKLLRDLLNRVQDSVEHNRSGNNRINSLLSHLNRHVENFEQYLGGLKQYNVQASRHDTPQLFEIPVSFGEEQERTLLRVYRRKYKKAGTEGEENSYKVVIDLNLKGTGQIRSEISQHGKHLQIDFLSPKEKDLEGLQSRSVKLMERLKERDLPAALHFRLRSLDEENPLEVGKTAPPSSTSRSRIDFSA